MIEFILYTLFSLVATGCVAKVLYFSTQDGQWLDKLIGWQKRLLKWDLQGKELFAKAGGLCEMCFSHAISFFSFWGYVLFMNFGLDLWISTGLQWYWAIPVNVIWYLSYVSIGTVISTYVITKMFK